MQGGTLFTVSDFWMRQDKGVSISSCLACSLVVDLERNAISAFVKDAEGMEEPWIDDELNNLFVPHYI